MPPWQQWEKIGELPVQQPVLQDNLLHRRNGKWLPFNQTKVVEVSLKTDIAQSAITGGLGRVLVRKEGGADVPGGCEPGERGTYVRGGVACDCG